LHFATKPLHCTGTLRTDDDCVHAVSFTTAELFPEMTDGPALKGEEQQEEDAIEFDRDDGDPEYDPVGSFDGYPEQEDTDTRFEAKIGEYVGRLAAPPPLQPMH
jgi:hypothetical protein